MITPLGPVAVIVTSVVMRSVTVVTLCWTGPTGAAPSVVVVVIGTITVTISGTVVVKVEVTTPVGPEMVVVTSLVTI